MSAPACCESLGTSRRRRRRLRLRPVVAPPRTQRRSPSGWASQRRLAASSVAVRSRGPIYWRDTNRWRPLVCIGLKWLRSNRLPPWRSGIRGWDALVVLSAGGRGFEPRPATAVVFTIRGRDALVVLSAGGRGFEPRPATAVVFTIRGRDALVVLSAGGLGLNPGRPLQ